LKNKDNKTTGIVLLNLGGPDSLRSVRPFLYNLFSDREIIRLGPSFLQKPVAWLISTIRSKKTEEMYQQIGGKSPILDITRAQAEALEKALGFELASTSPHPLFTKGEIKVYIGMRYWHPFIKDTVKKIIEDDIGKLIVLSLYPHYSKATTGSAFDEFKRRIIGKDINVQYIESWYDFPPYIDSLAELVAKGISEFQKTDFHLLYSAHSLPESFIKEGDPYLDHIKMTIERVNQRLSANPFNITGFKWHLSFQSKTGPVKWLEPTTEETILELANTGCKNVFVVPISFVSDHIETLYEIDILYKTIAEKNGIYIKRCESLNTSDKFINAIKELLMKKGI
jgi:ferrochelatase